MSDEPQPVLDELTVYCLALGLVVLRVCAPASMAIAEVERHANLQSPTGIESTWKVMTKADMTEYDEGDPTPLECDSDPGRLHYVLIC